MITSKIECVLHSPIEDIWSLMVDLHNQSWRSNIKKINIINYHRFIEYDNEGFQTEFVILNKIENKIYEFNLMNDNLEGHWIGKLKTLDNGDVSLEMTEALTMKKKIPSFLIKRYLHQQQKQYVKDLKQALGE